MSKVKAVLVSVLGLVVKVLATHPALVTLIEAKVEAAVEERLVLSPELQAIVKDLVATEVARLLGPAGPASVPFHTD